MAVAPDVSDTPQPVSVRVEDLHLDAQNPRVRDRGPLTQDEIVELLWREFAVNEIALSIAANGYLEYEPLIGEAEDDHFVVIEGNRRLAAVRLLRDATLRRRVGATDLPSISRTARAKLSYLPFIETERSAVWQYVGFKHVNGAQAWQSYNKAQYIAWVHNELGVSLEQIARHIGDYHSTVVRLYRALMVLDQAEKEGVFYREDRAKSHFAFSHLNDGVEIQRHPGLHWPVQQGGQ
jgi:hypothetical protein